MEKIFETLNNYLCTKLFFKTISVYQWGPSSSLSEKTLCMLGRTGGGKSNLYDNRNLYGLAETIVTRKALGKFIYVNISCL